MFLSAGDLRDRVDAEVVSKDVPRVRADDMSTITRGARAGKIVALHNDQVALKVSIHATGRLVARLQRAYGLLSTIPFKVGVGEAGVLGSPVEAEIREEEGVVDGELVFPAVGLVDAPRVRLCELTLTRLTTLRKRRGVDADEDGVLSALEARLSLRDSIIRLQRCLSVLHCRLHAAHRLVCSDSVHVVPTSSPLAVDGADTTVTCVLLGLWALLEGGDEGGGEGGGVEGEETKVIGGSGMKEVLAPEMVTRERLPAFGMAMLEEQQPADVFALGAVLSELVYGVRLCEVPPPDASRLREPVEGGGVMSKEWEDLRESGRRAGRAARRDARESRTRLVQEWLLPVLWRSQRKFARLLHAKSIDGSLAGLGETAKDNLRLRADPLFVDLIAKMCAVDATQRIPTASIHLHPFFLSYQQRIVWLSNIAESTGPDPVPHHSPFTKRYFQELECSSTPPRFPQPPPRIAEHPEDWVVREEEGERKVREEVLGLEGEEDVGKTGARKVDWVRACAFRAEAVGGGGGDGGGAGGGVRPVAMEYRLLRMAFWRDGVVIGARSDPTVWMEEQVGRREVRLAQLRQNLAEAPAAAQAHIQVQIDRNEDERQRLTAWITHHRGGRGSIAERAMLMRGGAAGDVPGPLEDETQLLFRQALDNDGERVWTHLYNNPIDPAATSPVPLPSLLAPVHISQLLRQVRNQWHHSYSHERVGDRHGDVEAELYHVLGGGLFLWVWKALQRASAHHPSPPWASFLTAVATTPAPPPPPTALSLRRLVAGMSEEERRVVRGDVELVAMLREMVRERGGDAEGGVG